MALIATRRRGFSTTVGPTTGAASASGRASTIVTSAAGSFTPLRTISFNGLSDAASIDSSTGTIGKRFDFWGTYSNGFGSRATTSVKRSGKTSSAALSIQSGNDGGTGGGTGPNGSFGGGFSALNSAERAVQGEWLHVGIWLFFPTGWSNLTSTAHLKFLRWQRSISGAPTGSKTELHLLDGSWNWAGAAGTTGSIAGIASIIEGQDVIETDSNFICSRLPALNAWNYVEYAVYAHSNSANTVIRHWLNDQFVWERNGSAVKWYGRKYNNLGGTPGLQTSTMAGTAASLASSNEALGDMMLFTYWNGGAPQTQTMYVDSICWAKDTASMTATDEFGNKMMGSSALP